jgi:hypothetical protein
MRGGEIGWTQAYERRMRKFNLKVIFAALTEGVGERFNWRARQRPAGVYWVSEFRDSAVFVC